MAIDVAAEKATELADRTDIHFRNMVLSFISNIPYGQATNLPMEGRASKKARRQASQTAR